MKQPTNRFVLIMGVALLAVVAFTAASFAAAAQEAPEAPNADVPGNCYEGDGDPVAVSVMNENVHGDHSGGNAVDASVKSHRQYEGDDDDLVDADVGDPYPAHTIIPGRGNSDLQQEGSDCDTVDADVASHNQKIQRNGEDGNDNDTVDADVQSYTLYGSDRRFGGEDGDYHDDDGADVDVASSEVHSTGDGDYSDDDTVDADIQSTSQEFFGEVDGEYSDDDTVDVDVVSRDGNDETSDDDSVTCTVRNQSAPSGSCDAGVLSPSHNGNQTEVTASGSGSQDGIAGSGFVWTYGDHYGGVWVNELEADSEGASANAMVFSWPRGSGFFAWIEAGCDVGTDGAPNPNEDCSTFHSP